MEEKEQQWGTFNITPNYAIGIGESYYPNVNQYVMDYSPSYLAKNSLIDASIIYYSMKERNSVKVAFFEWDIYDYELRKNKDASRSSFQKVIPFVEAYISQKYGKADEQLDNYGYDKSWKISDGINIIFHVNSKLMRAQLVIYKD